MTLRVRTTAWATTIALSAGLAVSAAAPVQAALLNTPPGQVLVVSVNLYDTDEPDASNTRDMKNFVERLSKQVPFIPDVLLLQEVRHKSVAAVKKFLESETGQRYSIAVDAGRAPWRQVSATKLVGTDSAILINNTTMGKQSGGYITTSYRLSQAAPGTTVKAKRAAYAMLSEKGSTTRIPVVSLHYPKQREFSSDNTSQALKKKWQKQIANKLENKYPDSGIDHYKVIGGDHNNFRCEGTPSPCNETPLYDLITGPGYNYKDSVLIIEGGAENPIDFIFTTGNVVTSGKDASYNPGTTNPGTFYSNHRFRWALMEGPDTTGPTNPGKITNFAGYGSFTRIRGWEKVHDGGTGFKHFEIWRSVGNDLSFVMHDTTQDQTYEDTSVTQGERYWYYVVAADKAGNLSKPTNTIDVKAGN